ncbi:pentapeptide repeat-containing protein [Streptomyces sp. NPDC049555]|uniref:pentapeptide repeat-containing protein n=1 Tax=Streptomyces sp. NPDC049555 TaxID=3154930 RepID=UPI00342A8BB7
MPCDVAAGWQPAALPADPEAARHLQEWLDDPSYSLYGIEQDFRGADLSGGNFAGGWFIGARLAGVRLAGACFYRADLQSADLTGADLTGACLVKANLDEAVLRSARLGGADMVRADLYEVDAAGAGFRGTRIGGAWLHGVDLRGADLADAVMSENSFKVRVDDTTVVRGLTGTVFGPITVVSGDASRELAGAELEAWIRARGGDVQVIPPHRQAG